MNDIDFNMYDLENELDIISKKKSMSPFELLEYLEKAKQESHRILNELKNEYDKKYGIENLNNTCTLKSGLIPIKEWEQYKEQDELKKKILTEIERIGKFRKLINPIKRNLGYTEVNEEKLNDKKGEYQKITEKKIKWCDNNYLTLMGIIELLEYAGYIPEDSFKNCGEIAANLFLKKDGKEISRKGFNNKKADYEKDKIIILGKIIDTFKTANKRILA